MEKVRQTSKALYFCNAAGLHFRLTHEGTNGWRLQVSKTSVFDNEGAAQMLSKFLGEKMKGSPKVLSYVQKRSTLIVTEKKVRRRFSPWERSFLSLSVTKMGTP